MKKSLFLIPLFLIPLSSQASDLTIDETKSDIYFANGILTTEEDAQSSLDLIREKTLEEQYSGNIVKMKQELNFDTAYNQTYGFTDDFYEAYIQLADEDMGWGTLRALIQVSITYAGGVGSKVVDLAMKIVSLGEGLSTELSKISREADLNRQITQYQKSIRSGHGVIVIAHSQGNLFTNEAYKKII